MQGDINKRSDWADGFVSGLVCGEGNFTIAVVKAPSCRLGFHARPIFQVELGIVDMPLIHAVQRFFGFGSVSYPQMRTRVRNESATIRYSVTAIRDCELVADFFARSPLVGAKQQAFIIWCKCLGIIREGRHTTTDGFQEIIKLREGINQTKRPSGFRAEASLLAEARAAAKVRPLAMWTDDELRLINQYIAGAMSRADLIAKLGRSVPSVANQIKRVREAQKGR